MCKCIEPSMTVECHKRMSDLGGHKPTLKGPSKGFGSKKVVYEPLLFKNFPYEPLLFKPPRDQGASRRNMS